MEKRMTNPKSEGYISAKDMAGRAAYYKVLQAAKNGELTRINRGVYATDDHLASQMLDVEKVVPGGVLCLYSAWSHYHGLSAIFASRDGAAVERSVSWWELDRLPGMIDGPAA